MTLEEAIQIAIKFVSRKRFESFYSQTTEKEIQAMDVIIEHSINTIA